MATAMLECRVCGKKYEACRTAKRVDGVFRWQNVACSPECGATYLRLIRESRAKNCLTDPADKFTQALNMLEAEYDEYEDDYLEDEEFEDDDSDDDSEIE